MIHNDNPMTRWRTATYKFLEFLGRKDDCILLEVVHRMMAEGCFRHRESGHGIKQQMSAWIAPYQLDLSLDIATKLPIY